MHNSGDALYYQIVNLKSAFCPNASSIKGFWLIVNRLLLIVIFLLRFDGLVFANSSWTKQDSGTDAHLYSVDFINENIGLVGGENGTLLRTSDGGMTWTPVDSLTDKNIVSISFINNDVGYFAATDIAIRSPYSGTNYVFKTVDSGLSWNRLDDFSSSEPIEHSGLGWTGRFTKVSFVNENVGYVAGYEGLFYKTIDGGLSWQYHPYPAFSYTIQDICVADETTVYVTAANSLFYKTVDSGESWSLIDVGVPDIHLSAIDFQLPNVGYVGSLSSKGFFNTTDGGNTWTNIKSDAEGTAFSRLIYDLDVVTPNFVVAVGGNDGYPLGPGTIYESTDMGITWDKSSFQDTNFFHEVDFPSNSIGFAVGQEGAIYRYNNSTTLIKLASFGADCQSNEIIIAWNTLSELDNAGFNLWRSEAENGSYIKINSSLIEAVGGATLSAEYSFTDATAIPGGTYYYKLEDIDTSGGSTFHGPVSAKIPAIKPISWPLWYTSYLNYPWNLWSYKW
jgi:photosystem II stability/assembly factor-like uncharacterized protein